MYNPDAKVLVLVPSLALLEQTFHKWRRRSAEKFSYMCVCSDRTVTDGSVTAPDTKQDNLVTLASEVDFPVSTQPEDVCRFLQHKGNHAKILFCTYQSSPVVAAGMRKSDVWDLAIFDEAHKTAGCEGRSYAFALKDENIRIKKRVFFTATPRHYKPRDQDPSEVFSMDNENVYGQQAYTLSFAKAIELKRVCRYKVIVSVLTTEQIDDDMLSESDVLVDRQLVKARQPANQLALTHAVKKYDIKKIITFHGRVRSAESFTSDGPEGIAGYLPEFDFIGHVHGKMTTARRAHSMTDFRRAEKGLMANARCLTEGVDVPEVDMVAFLSKKESYVDIVQAIGRAMRKPEGSAKGLAYIFVPAYVQIAEGETYEQAIARSDFTMLWNVLDCLAEVDEVLAELLKERAEAKGRGIGYDDSKLKEYVEFISPRIELEDLRKAVETHSIDGCMPSWNERYGQLVAYKILHGHCNVPQDDPTGVGRWCGTQRYEFQKGRLFPEQIALLNKIGFWWNVLEAQWEQSFHEYCQFRKEHGHEPEFGSKLYMWGSTQRRIYSQDKLSPERIERLNKEGFCWHRFDDSWHKRFQELKAFYQKTGHCLVPQGPGPLAALARWVSKQREYRARGRSFLSQEKIDLLSGIDFCWDVKEALFASNFQQLYEFYQQNGHFEVNRNDNPKLSSWIQNVRARYKRGQLPSDERKQFRTGQLSEAQLGQLNKIGFPWSVPTGRRIKTKITIGQRFGLLTVISEAQKVNGRLQHLVQCDCGNKKLIVPSVLTRPNTQSCGCKGRARPDEIRIGQRFGLLTVISKPQKVDGHLKVRVQCDCGKTRLIGPTPLRQGHNQSCGCIGRRRAAAIQVGQRFGPLTVTSEANS